MLAGYRVTEILEYFAGGNAKWYIHFRKLCQLLINLNIYIFYGLAILLLGIVPRNERLCPIKDFHMNVYNSFFHSTHKMGITQMPINKCLDNELSYP